MTRQTRRGILTVLGGSVAVSGCLGTRGDGESAGAAGGNGDGDGDAETTAWRTAELTDVTTDEQFAISEFDDPALVHPFAVWCSTCGSQNREIDTLQREFGGDREVVQLNIGDGETDDEVLEYAEENGYADHSRFAVAPTPVADALVEEFGPTAVSPPQSPVVLQCPEGGTHELDKISDAETIASRIDADCG